MTGQFYVQLRPDGNKVINPIKRVGYISVETRKLICFNSEHQILLEMHILDFWIAKDGMMFMGIEESDGRKLYQEVFFVPGADIDTVSEKPNISTMDNPPERESGQSVKIMDEEKGDRLKIQDRWCGRGGTGPTSNYMCGRG